MIEPVFLERLRASIAQLTSLRDRLSVEMTLAAHSVGENSPEWILENIKSVLQGCVTLQQEDFPLSHVELSAKAAYTLYELGRGDDAARILAETWQTILLSDEDSDETDFALIEVGEAYAICGDFENAVHCSYGIYDPYRRVWRLLDMVCLEAIEQNKPDQLQYVLQSELEPWDKNYLIAAAAKHYATRGQHQASIELLSDVDNQETKAAILIDTVEHGKNLKTAQRLELLKQAKSLAEQVEQTGSKIQLLCKIGHQYLSLEQNQEAHKVAQRAQVLASDLVKGDRITDQVPRDVLLEQVAFLLEKLKEHDASLEVIQEMQTGIAKAQMLSLPNDADLSPRQKQQRINELLSLSEESSEKDNDISDLQRIQIIGSLVERGEQEAAEKVYQQLQAEQFRGLAQIKLGITSENNHLQAVVDLSERCDAMQLLPKAERLSIALNLLDELSASETTDYSRAWNLNYIIYAYFATEPIS